MTEQPLNTGKEWSKNELFSLRNRIEHGRTVAHVATFLMRTETEIREGSRARTDAASVVVLSSKAGWRRGPNSIFTRYSTVAMAESPSFHYRTIGQYADTCTIESRARTVRVVTD